MWIWIANIAAKFRAKRLNQSENIPKSFGWLVATFLKHRVGGHNYIFIMTLQYGVLQGSVLGPRIFMEYAEDVSDIFASHGLWHHLFADDMQHYCSGRSGDVVVVVVVVVYLYSASRSASNALMTFMWWLQELNSVFPTLATDALPRDCN